jgi:hypothetical protein
MTRTDRGLLRPRGPAIGVVIAAVGAAFMTGVALSLGSCGLLVGIPNVTLAGDDGPIADSGSHEGDAPEGDGSVNRDAPSSEDAAPCQLRPDGAPLPGPPMIEITYPLEDGSIRYCIDTTEVTVGQLNTYVVATGGVRVDVPAACEAADVTVPPSVRNDVDPTLPVGDVNVCDAWSYCGWAGKRLCGAIGDGGSIYNHEVTTTGHENEWHYACINGVHNLAYPYGQTYEPDACDTEEAEDGGPRPSGSMPSCHGKYPPFDRIHDMSGNVSEIVNDFVSCSLGGNQWGGDWSSGSSASMCDSLAPNGSCYFDFPQSGFRCCRDP